MRLFLAVPLADALRLAIAEAIDRLKLCDADVRWVEPENLHLTVAFLGDRSIEDLAECERISQEVAAETQPFRISVSGLSSFPRKGLAVKTLYIGLSEGAVAWTELARRTELAFVALGVPPANDLIPHLTLGRVKGERNIEDLRVALSNESETMFGSLDADHMILIESRLNPTGAIYQNVRTCRFSAIETE